ncbi:hypothetical protein AB833_14305 [Chromatiales bacterium (ex Bugula neritina AB1)]|nr:hypothetical protein AB833_14305 [Chromatiales bacterium (ex Bugula neritina AB1)]
MWKRNTVTGAAGSDISEQLLKSYSENGRYYHTCGHISFCLSVFDQASNLCLNPDAVEVALWFHDAVFNFPINENERLSAEYFMRVSESVMPDSFRERVYGLVMATRHLAPPTDPDEQIMVDIDLSSFGQAWEFFNADGQNVRRELSYLGDGEYFPNQIEFMSKLVERPYFYNTPWFREHFEAQARDNVERYLRDLREKGY